MYFLSFIHLLASDKHCIVYIQIVITFLIMLNNNTFTTLFHQHIYRFSYHHR